MPFDIDPWRIHTQPPEVQKVLRKRYRTAGRMGRIVVAVRDLTVPRHELGPEGLFERLEFERQRHRAWRQEKHKSENGIGYAEECAESFFSSLNAWRKERVRPFGTTGECSKAANRLLKDRNLARLRREGRDEQYIAGQIACGHACLAIHHVREAILALIREADPAESLAKAIEEAAQTAFWANTRDGKSSNLDAIRTDYRRRFAI